MKIVHLNINPETTTPQKASVPTRHLKKLTERELFAQEMALKGYKRALKKYADDIIELQADCPGWVPEFKYQNNK